jgi:hypothetical protein
MLLVKLLAGGEVPRVRYPPTAATAITTTTIPTKAELLTALRFLEEVE